MLTRALLAISCALLSYTATAAEPDRCIADTARAEADLVTAQRTQFEAMGPVELVTANQLVAAAVEQLRAVKARCTVVPDKRLAKRIAKLKKLQEPKRPKRVVVLKPPVEVDPFASPADPFEPEPLPPAPKLIPVPGIQWLVDPVVAQECLAPGSDGTKCPIVVVVPARQ